MFEPTPTLPNVDFRQLFMWIEQSHIWPFRLNITLGWLQKLNPGYEICIISYQVNLSSEVSAMFSSLMPSLNIRSLPFVVFLGIFRSRCQNLSSGAIRPGGLLFRFLLTILWELVNIGMGVLHVKVKYWRIFLWRHFSARSSFIVSSNRVS